MKEEFNKLKDEVGEVQMSFFNRLTAIEDTAERTNKLEEEIGKCQIEVYQRLKVLENSMTSVKNTLKTQQVQREEFNENILYEMSTLKEWFSYHDTKEMNKYDEVIKAIKDLSTTIISVQHNADEALDFVQLMRKYWVRLTFTGTGIIITLTSLYALYSFLKKHGLVIVFEGGL